MQDKHSCSALHRFHIQINDSLISQPCKHIRTNRLGGFLSALASLAGSAVLLRTLCEHWTWEQVLASCKSYFRCF